ncbi:DUF4189 domain-containing protein [Nocardia sp. NPDC051832]|uniref:DUF4189 domain-containing protein n=1 Tax=Nocardia sp. NPDC051832 TaxID=3155673 RepID=UPI00342A6CEE
MLGKSALVAAVTSSAAVTVLAAAPAEAAGKYYGTFGISWSTGKTIASVDHASKVAADAAAIRDCGVYDCELVLRIVDGCGAIARGADGKWGWAAAGSLEDAEHAAVASLGDAAPPFPDLGSSQPRPAAVVTSACTKNIR